VGRIVGRWRNAVLGVLAALTLVPRGVRASPGESVLVLNDPPTRWVWSFRIEANGSLARGRHFCRLETKGKNPETDAGGWRSIRRDFSMWPPI
jgi:hypothetical protein